MATIIKHRRTGNQYILLSINGETNKTNPSRFISELFDREKPEVSCSATVCDTLGNIFIADIDDLQVVEIDGIKPADILPEVSYEPPEVNDSNTYGTLDSDFDEFEEEFEEELEEELEEAFDRESDSEPTLTIPIRNSLDAPHSDDSDDDKDWI